MCLIRWQKLSFFLHASIHFHFLFNNYSNNIADRIIIIMFYVNMSNILFHVILLVSKMMKFYWFNKKAVRGFLVMPPSFDISLHCEKLLIISIKNLRRTEAGHCINFFNSPLINPSWDSTQFSLYKFFGFIKHTNTCP